MMREQVKFKYLKKSCKDSTYNFISPNVHGTPSVRLWVGAEYIYTKHCPIPLGNSYKTAPQQVRIRGMDYRLWDKPGFLGVAEMIYAHGKQGWTWLSNRRLETRL